MTEKTATVLTFVMSAGIYFSERTAVVICITKKYSNMVETLIGIAAGFAVMFFVSGVVAVLWQAAKYMASRGMGEDEEYES